MLVIMMSMASTCLTLAIQCYVLMLLTSAAPLGKNSSDVSLIRTLVSQGGETQRQTQAEYKGRELQDHTDSPRVTGLELNMHLYRQASLSMAEDDFFPVHLCGEDALASMRQVLSSFPHDGLQQALVMTTFMQDKDCPRGALHTATKLMDCVKNVTSQHRHDVLTVTDDVISEPARAVSSDEAGQGGQAAQDHCSLVAECHHRGVAEVRAIMADEPDLLLLYDGVAAGVFFAGGHPALAQALSQDLHQTLRARNSSLEHQRFKRFSFSETDVHTLIEWIPVPYLGTAYNVVTAAYYWHLGNTSEAESRLVSAGVDLVVSGAVHQLARGVNPLVEEGFETFARKGVKSGIGYK